MRCIKLLLISFILLFIVVMSISLFIPSRVRISRAVNMRSPATAIWKQVDDMRNWKDWNPFFMQLDFSTIEKADSSGGTLRSMLVQGTEIKWQEIKPDEHIASFQKGDRKPVYNGWNVIAHGSSDSTTVQWYMDFHLSWYPWEKFASLAFDRSYGPQMEQGLSNLKKITETDLSSRN